MNLPADFHWNHPRYTKWIEGKIDKQHLDTKEIEGIRDQAISELNKAVDEWQISGQRINKYFKKLNQAAGQ